MERNNVLSLLNDDLQRHKVRVSLPYESEQKSLYLIMIMAKTSLLKDFSTAYFGVTTDLHHKIAKKIFGEEETENTYGVFLDDELRMVFAFNRAFADFDRKKGMVVYKDVDDVLIEKVEPMGAWKDSEKKIPAIQSEPFRRRDRDGAIKYSIAEKKRK